MTLLAPRFAAAIALVVAGLFGRIASAEAGHELRPDRNPQIAEFPSHGKLASLRIRSSILGEDRHVWVTLPVSHASTTRRYPVLLVLDGEALFAPTAAAVAWLSEVGHMPESIVVGIENTNRLRDLTPPGLSVSGSSAHEGGERFLDFLQNELLPALRAQYRGGPLSVLMGHSSGAILATYAAAARAEAFPFIVALDTPIYLGDNWLASRLIERPARPTEPPLRYVSIESKFGWPDRAWREWVRSAPRSWRLQRERLAAESHESMPLLGMYAGLRRIFDDYSMVGDSRQPACRRLDSYRDLTPAYGMELPPPSLLLREAIDDALVAGEASSAQRALDGLVAAYGAPPDRRELAARIAALAKRPPPTETVESLLAAPMPAPGDARDYLGEWRGEMWIAPESRAAIGLRLSVVEGQTRGDFVTWSEPGVEEVQKLQYLRVTPDGLHFGFLNETRPRAVCIYEGVLRGGVLEGQMRFGGIADFRLQDGRTPPVLHFLLRRASKNGPAASH
jgi:hypothetical protein